jgi:hypothetical protein
VSFFGLREETLEFVCLLSLFRAGKKKDDRDKKEAEVTPRTKVQHKKMRSKAFVWNSLDDRGSWPNTIRKNTLCFFFCLISRYFS